MILREYQQRAIDAIRTEAKSGKKKILLVAPTGAGKTVIASDLIRSAENKDKHVLFIAHRREILEQTAKKLKAIDIHHGWIMSGKEKSALATVQLASIQTLIRRNHPIADIVIWDEIHHCRSKSYQDVFKKYPDAFHVGLTATPCRGDGKGLGVMFETLIQPVTYAELIEQGHLVPVTTFAPSVPDLKGVRTVAGDYNEADLSDRMDKPKLIGDIVQHWEKLASERQTLVFAVTIAHALHITEAFVNAGHDFVEIDGETEPGIREATIEKLKTGKIKGIVNVGLFTEGTDIPEVSCLVLARPTKSFGFYRQIVGRGLRPAEGKLDCLLIDHSGAVYQHGIPTDDVVWTLSSDDIAYSHVKKTSEKNEGANWTCKFCSYLNVKSRSPYCASCSLKLTKLPLGVAIKDGELKMFVPKAKVKFDPAHADKQKIWNDCLYIAKHKNLKVGAAAHMYKNKMGVWPRQVEKLPRGLEWKMRTDEFLQMKRV